MTRKCIVFGCKTGFSGVSTNAPKFSLYRFPADPADCKRWISALPNKFPPHFNPTRNQCVCSRHWPETALMKPCPGNKKGTPVDPPSIFPDVPQSCIPSAIPSRAKKIKLSSDKSRDQLSNVIDIDALPEELTCNMISGKFPSAVVYHDLDKNDIVLHSKEKEGPLYIFNITITNTGKLQECYHKAELITIPFLHVMQLTKWSQMHKVVNYVLSYDNKKSSFVEHEIARMSRKMVGSRKYTNEDILFAMEMISRSRSTYRFLRKYITLPSERLLRNVTSGISTIDDTAFLRGIINSLQIRQRRCSVQLDEVYIKTENDYRGGSFFGFTPDGSKARTLLYFLIKFEFGGPVIPFKYFPCSKVTHIDMLAYYVDIRNIILAAGGTIVTVISDNNRTNQKFLDALETKFPGEELTLIDSVHLMKSLRNNWFVKGLLTYLDPDTNNQKRVAKWNILCDIYDEEAGDLLKKSVLTAKSINPKNIEKQSVPLALQVFSEKTYAAALPKDEDTAQFIRLCSHFFSICNNRYVGQDKRTRNEHQAEIRNISQLDWLILFSNAMQDSDLSRDTRLGLKRYTTNIKTMCERLLKLEDYNYILLGRYQTDDLEKYFSKLRQKVGGGYFITHMQAAHTTRIALAKYALRAQMKLEETDESPFDLARKPMAHSCANCNRPLNNEEENSYEFALDTVLIGEISLNIREAVVHVGGYLIRKEKFTLLDDDCPPEWTNYVNVLNRGGLSLPSSALVNFISICYTFFTCLQPNNICVSFLIRQFSSVLLYFPCLSLISNSHLRSLSNILCNNLSKLSKEDSVTSSKKSLLKFE